MWEVATLPWGSLQMDNPVNESRPHRDAVSDCLTDCPRLTPFPPAAIAHNCNAVRHRVLTSDALRCRTPRRGRHHNGAFMDRVLAFIMPDRAAEPEMERVAAAIRARHPDIPVNPPVEAGPDGRSPMLRVNGEITIVMSIPAPLPRDDDVVT